MKIITTGFAAAAILLAVQTSNAIPTVTLADNNGNSTTVTDASGVVNFSGAVGNWLINAGAGIGAPPAPGGSATSPKLDLGSFDFFGTGYPTGNVLTITFTDDNLGPISGLFSHFLTGSGTSISAVFKLLVNNVVVDTLTGLNGTNHVNIVAGSGTTIGLQAILTATANGAHTSLDNGLESVPDSGATIAMLGFGLVGVAFFARKRKIA